jgi:predicted nucleic acid-binding protein
MTDRIFLDTPIIIYLIEKNPAFFESVSLFIAESIEADCSLFTSVLTTAEFGIKPRKLNRLSTIHIFEKTVKSLLEVKEIDWEVAEISTILRAKYFSLRAMDSLQIACAIRNKCNRFVTNDRRLRAIKEINIQLITEL